LTTALISPDKALLDKFGEVEAAPLVADGQRHDEPDVGEQEAVEGAVPQLRHLFEVVAVLGVVSAQEQFPESRASEHARFELASQGDLFVHRQEAGRPLNSAGPGL